MFADTGVFRAVFGIQPDVSVVGARQLVFCSDRNRSERPRRSVCFNNIADYTASFILTRHGLLCRGRRTSRACCRGQNLITQIDSIARNNDHAVYGTAARARCYALCIIVNLERIAITSCPIFGVIVGTVIFAAANLDSQGIIC